MILTNIFLAFALTTSPAPSANYNSWISPEISAEIVENITCGNADKMYLDFNGDNVLNVADAVGVLKRYTDNVNNGNELTIDSETVSAIYAENFTEDMEYFEFYNINGDNCRQYDITVSDVSIVDIWVENEEIGTTIKVKVNPIEEYVEVLEILD